MRGANKKREWWVILKKFYCIKIWWAIFQKAELKAKRVKGAIILKRLTAYKVKRTSSKKLELILKGVFAKMKGGIGLMR